MKNFAIIVAGGSGTRLGNEKPKQFLEVNGKPLLMYSVEKFDKHPQIAGIILVINNQYITEVKQYLLRFNTQKVIDVIPGGETRQQSVFNGLKKVKEIADENDSVLIHDAARPLVSEKTISDNISAVKKYLSVDTVIPCSDTIIKSTDGKQIDNVPNRKELYQGQTPQTFKFSLIYKAHLNAIEKGVIDVSDDVSLITMLGEKTYLVFGDPLNFKVTTPHDLTIFQSLLNNK